MSEFNYRCSYFQRQQWECYVAASWVPYLEHYVIRSTSLCGLGVLYLAQIIY